MSATVLTENRDGVQVAEAPVAIRSFDVNAEMLGISLVKPHSLSGRGEGQEAEG